MARGTKFQRRLKEAARGGAAAAHRCRLLAAQYGGVHVFVEGGDDRPFYEPLVVAAYNTTNVWFHVADGRTEVLHAQTIIPSSFTLAQKTLFIIDRDFDGVSQSPPPLPPRVFSTCFYSVESYFISPDALRALFATQGNIDWSSRFASDLRASLNQLLDEASVIFRVAMAIAIAAREQSVTANLNNVRVSAMCTVDADGRIKLKPHFLSTFVRQANINVGTINRVLFKSALGRIRGQDVRMWIRGKYLLALMVDLVRARYRQANDLKRAKDPAFRHARTRVGINADDLMKMCSGHLPCPAAFASYMSTI